MATSRKQKNALCMIKPSLKGKKYDFWKGKVRHKRINKVRTDILEQEMSYQELSSTYTKNINGCIDYCKHLLSNLSDIWKKSDLSLRQRLQGSILPQGIYFEGETFRTEAIAFIFKYVQQPTSRLYKMASRT